MKPLLVLGLVAIGSACAGIRTTVEYDPVVSFQGYERYEWATDPAGVTDSPQRLVIHSEFDAHLKARGYQWVRANPDFLVHFHMAPEGVDFPESYRTLGYRPSRNLPVNLDGREYPSDALIFDVIDRDSRELVWRGVATRVFDSATGRFVRMKLGVEILLRGFPPG